MFFHYDYLSFNYEPFPIGLAKPLMEEATYQEFVKSYPPLELFKSIPKVGHKFSLSEKYNERHYWQFIKSHPLWYEFYSWIKSDEFIQDIMAVLKEHHIDLGYKPSSKSAMKEWMKRLRDGGRRPRSSSLHKLRSRFEFSALPADGGYVQPHTDVPSKIVTIIVSMVSPGEWDANFGGGTEVNHPKKPALSFNRLNRKADFHDMEILNTYEFTPNQAVIFVKTFNSWHSVRPMTGVGSEAMRKTLTINIEACS